MRSLAVLPLLACLFSLPLSALDSEEALHAPDGNVREMIMSISIPPVENAPFSGTVTTEWKRTLEDGSMITLQNHRTVMRDSAGRIFQERRRLVPEGQEPAITWLEISDPKTHMKYFCYPSSHQCVKRDYFMPASVTTVPEGTSSDGQRVLSRENLGTNTLVGMNVIGTRETTTINAGAMGNDNTLSVIKEFWYSQKLGINLSVKRMDPRHGTQIFAVTDVSLAAPEAKNFSIPAGYTIQSQNPVHRAAHVDAAASR